MHSFRHLAELLEPLALLRAVASAWPLGVAILLDWPIVRWWLRARPGKRAGRSVRRGRLPAGWLAVLINLAAAVSTLLAIWCVDRFLGWLPGQFGNDILTRTIAERRVRGWEAALLLPMVTLCVLGAKIGVLRVLIGRWPGLWVWGALAMAWVGLLGVVWGVGRLGVG